MTARRGLHPWVVSTPAPDRAFRFHPHRAQPRPSFRTEQADFFFRIRSCECVGLRREKSLFSSGTAVGINLSPHVLDYFKGLADETGLPYQKLLDLYLLDCAKKRKKLTMKWVA